MCNFFYSLQIWSNVVFCEETNFVRDLEWETNSFTVRAVPLDDYVHEYEEISGIDGAVENHDIP